MLKKLFFILLLGASLNGFAQKVDENDLPAGVVRVFKITFPEAYNVFWQKTDTSFIADFTFNDSKTRGFFSLNGDHILSEWDVPIEFLPKKIKDQIENGYKGFKIKNAFMVRKAGDSEVRYKINLNKKKETRCLMFGLGNQLLSDEKK